ncbi:MAG: integrase core domain-containing protein, partial [Pseudomonadota bacterium]
LHEAAPRANDPLERFLIPGSLNEHWRRHYNTVRPHSALNYRPPEPEAILPVDQMPVMHEQSNRTTR